MIHSVGKGKGKGWSNGPASNGVAIVITFCNPW